jgi:hypothetical protein
MTGFSKLNDFIIYGINEYSIKRDAFVGMLSVNQLKLLYRLNLTYEEGSFYGLHNLTQLTIRGRKCPTMFIYEARMPMKCLEKSLYRPGQFEAT